MVDKTLVLRKLADLETYLVQIKEFENVSVAEYNNDWKTQRTPWPILPQGYAKVSIVPHALSASLW